LEVDLRQLEQMEGDKLIDASDLKIVRINRTSRTIAGTIVYHVRLDNSYLMEGILYIKQGGEYRKLPYRMPPKGLCDFINEEKYIYPEVTKVSNMPEVMPCPMPVVS
jgi:hypothetical protein